ncbi:MAG: hypothetical protein AB1Z57_01045 [Acidimicrobiia bacterium]
MADDSNPPEQSPRDLEAEVAVLRAQVAELEQSVAEREGGRRSRVRSVGAGLGVAISALLVLLALVAWWVHGVVFDTDSFMEIVEPAITSEAFETQLSESLSESTIEALALEARLEARLSAFDTFLAEGLVEALDLGDTAIAIISRLDLPRFADLADPLATAANTRIAEGIDRLVRSDQFGLVTVEAVRRGHEAAVDLITDDLGQYENVYRAEGELRLDTLPLVAGAIEWVVEEGLLDGEDIQPPDLSDNPRLEEALERVSAAVGEQVPDDLGQVTIMSEDQLDTIQAAGRTFDRLVWVLIGAAVVSIAVTLWVAPRRRRTVVQLALAVLIALALAYVATNRITLAVQDAIAEQGVADAFGVFATVMTGSLGSVLGIVAGLAVVAGLLAHLAGRPAWVQALLGPLGEEEREPSDLDRFVDRYLEALTVLDVAVFLLVAWLSALNPWWTGGALVLLGLALWWGYAARARVRREREAAEAVGVVIID